jgi:hypothetical protein
VSPKRERNALSQKRKKPHGTQLRLRLRLLGHALQLLSDKGLLSCNWAEKKGHFTLCCQMSFDRAESRQRSAGGFPKKGDCRSTPRAVRLSVDDHGSIQASIETRLKKRQQSVNTPSQAWSG